MGAAVRGGRRRSRRQHQLLAHARRRPAGGCRGQPRRRRDPPRGIVANPNCSTMQMVVALAPIHRAVGIERDRSSPPTSRSRAPVGARSRSSCDQSRATLARRARSRRGLPAPDRVQRPAPGGDVQGRRRLHHRGAQDDGRDPQDPRGRRGRDGDLRDLRAGSGDRRPLRVGQHPDARGPQPRGVPGAPGRRPGRHRDRLRRPRASIRCRSTRRAATTSWWVASAATRPPSAASTSGSSATTFARARPPTPSRSPRSWSGPACRSSPG